MEPREDSHRHGRAPASRDTHEARRPRRPQLTATGAGRHAATARGPVAAAYRARPGVVRADFVFLGAGAGASPAGTWREAASSFMTLASFR